jgi:hypothetical protein
MHRLGPILIAIVTILTGGADTQVHDPPLFAAAFCVDTGARPDAVKSAVEATGGKQRVPPSATALLTWIMKNSRATQKNDAL